MRWLTRTFANTPPATATWTGRCGHRAIQYDTNATSAREVTRPVRTPCDPIRHEPPHRLCEGELHARRDVRRLMPFELPLELGDLRQQITAMIDDVSVRLRKRVAGFKQGTKH